MNHVERQIKAVEEHWDELVKEIAKFRDRALERRMSIICKRQVLAEQKRRSGF